MATVLENLQTRLANIAAELAAMSSTSAGGKPDAGKSGVGHVAYRLSLLQEMKAIQEAIDKEALNSTGGDGTCFEVVTECYT